MKKVLKKKQVREQKTLQLYGVICLCSCSCSGCGSMPADDYVNVKDNHGYNVSASGLF